MSQKPISPLRRRMIEDMTVRKFAEKTRNDYIRHVKTFARPSSAARPTRERPRICGFSNCTRARLACVRQPSMARFPRYASCLP
jgi:hypothetical protein